MGGVIPQRGLVLARHAAQLVSRQLYNKDTAVWVAVSETEPKRRSWSSAEDRNRVTGMAERGERVVLSHRRSNEYWAGRLAELVAIIPKPSDPKRRGHIAEGRGGNW